MGEVFDVHVLICVIYIDLPNVFDSVYLVHFFQSFQNLLIMGTDFMQLTLLIC